MNAVWLNDELMVSPAAVVGLVCRSDEDNYMLNWSHYRVVEIVLVGGDRLEAWMSDVERINPLLEGRQHEVPPAKARTKAAALAEMERLSALLWPSPPEFSFEQWKRNSFFDGLRMYDPELHGLPVCRALEDDADIPGSRGAFCNLAEGHPGPHRFGPTFDEAHPPERHLCREIFSYWYCGLDHGHEGDHDYSVRWS